MWKMMLGVGSLMVALTTNVVASRAQGPPNSPSANDAMTAGVRAMKLHDAADAAGHFAEAVRLAPGFAEAHLDRGMVQEQLGDLEGAEQSLKTAAALRSQLRGVHLFLAIVQYRRGEVDSAVGEILQAVKLGPSDANAWMWQGIINMDGGDLETATMALDRAHRLDPHNIDILYQRGQAHLRLSRQSLEQIVQIDSASWRVHQLLAQAAAESGHLDTAVAEYKHAIELEPAMPQLQEELGDLLWKAGDQAGAEQAYERELKNEPSNSFAAYKLGALRVRQQRPQDGLALLKQAVKVNGFLYEAWYYMADAQMQSHEYDSAVASLRKVTDGSAEGDLRQAAFYRLWRVYRLIGREQDAAAAFAEFKRLKTADDMRRSEQYKSIKNARAKLPVNALEDDGLPIK